MNEKLQSLQMSVKFFSHLSNLQRIALFLYKPEQHMIQGFSGYNLGNAIARIAEPWRNAPVCPMTLTSELPVYIPEAARHGLPRQYVEQFNLRSLIIIPLIANAKIIGSAIADRSGCYFEPSRELLDICIRFGSHVGVTLYTLLQNQDHEQNPFSLSPRELEVLQLAAFGQSTKEIATRLHLSEFTVRDYMKTATEKLQAKNRTEAVAVALRLGLIQ
jgi:DNA-binding CsgD family transcriptional regulator